MTQKNQKSGFTLVELLVVIAILAVLASLSMVVGTKMLARGKAVRVVNNIRQIGPLLNIYATEHNMQLPAINDTQTLDDGSVINQQWHEALLAEYLPDEDPAKFKTQLWWDTNDKIFLINPAFEVNDSPRGKTPLNPGFAFNEMIANNIIANNPDSSDEPAHQMRIPLALIDEPSRTPVVAPYNNFFYRFDTNQIREFTNPTLKKFLNNDKFPVLFLDGSVEVLRPIEYTNRRLDRMPLPPNN